MTDVQLAVSFPDPPGLAVELAEGRPSRVIAGLGIPFGVPSGPSRDGHRYQFDGPPDNLDELVDVVRGHQDDAVVGRLAQAWAPSREGLPARARIFSTTAGNDTLEEAREGVLTGFSAGVQVHRFTDGPVRLVDAGAYSVRHLSLERRPAFTQSAGLTVDASAQEGPAMTAPTTAPPAPPATPPAPPPTTPPATPPRAVELPTIAELAAEVSAVLAATTPASTHALARFSREADFVQAVWAADDDERTALRAAFAVPDQILTDNPGLQPPVWRSQIQMNLDARRPAITASGGSIALPPSGLESTWPYFAGDLDTIIAQQAAEKTELAGVKISILKSSEPIKTAGTVSDISYQLLMRSSPSYLEAYLRICRAAWARYTEAKFEAALVARAGTPGEAPAADDDGSALYAAIWAASTDVEDATGSPATYVGLASDLWRLVGGLPAFKNPLYGTQNVAGTASAASLTANVNGIPVKRFPFIPDGNIIVSNGEAAKFADWGPQVATAEDVRKLGRDVAVWGMYEDAEVYFPAGVVLLTPAPVVPLDAEPEPEAGKTTKK